MTCDSPFIKARQRYKFELIETIVKNKFENENNIEEKEQFSVYVEEAEAWTRSRSMRKFPKAAARAFMAEKHIHLSTEDLDRFYIEVKSRIEKG